MLLNRSHPLLRGCRLLWFGNEPATAKNRVGGGAAGVITGTGTGRCGPWKSIEFNGGSNKIVWGTGASYGIRHTGFTVISRCRVTGDNGNTGQLAGIGANKNGGGNDSTSGWQLYWIKDTYANTGWNFALYTTGGFYFARATGTGGAGEYGKDRVIAGVYDPHTHGPRIYVDGLENTTLGANSVGSPTTVDWDVTNNTAMHFANAGPGESAHLVGGIGWVAMFDRALTPREIAIWSRDDRWPFLTDPPVMPFVTGTTYRTVVGGTQAYSSSGAGGLIYNTTVDALAYVGGDVVIDPAEGDILEFSNRVAAGQHYVGDTPTVVRYANRVQANQVLTTYPTLSYANVVRVGQRRRSLVDGRADILSAGRYRR